MKLWHVTFSSATRHALFPGAPLRRAALRRVIALAAGELVLYSLVDDHLHLVTHCSVSRAPVLERAIVLALRPLVMGQISTHRRPVEGRSHLLSLLRYHLNQVVKHDIEGACPALWEGSCFQDLSGARRLVDIRPRLAELLPRAGRLLPHELVGLPRREIEPASDRVLRRAGVDRLASAAGVSLLTGPALTGRTRQVVLARRATAQLAAGAGISSMELRWFFDADQSTVWRWRRPTVDSWNLRAIRVRISLEDLIARR